MKQTFLKKAKQTPNLFGFSSLFSGPRVLCSNFRCRGCGFIWHQMHNFWARWKRATFWQLCACSLYCELFAWQEEFLFVEATDLRFLLKSVVLSSRHRVLSHWWQKCVSKGSGRAPAWRHVQWQCLSSSGFIVNTLTWAPQLNSAYIHSIGCLL